jgi:hypothetical protein
MKRKGVIRSRKSKDNQYDVEMKSANNGLCHYPSAIFLAFYFFRRPN